MIINFKKKKKTDPSKTTSAYEQIKANIDANGTLSQSFSLEEKSAPNRVGFIAGAMDGIGFFHSAQGAEKASVEQLANLLRKYFITGQARCLTEVETVLRDIRTISVIDPLLQNISDNHQGINPNRMVDLSLQLIRTSGNTELIKIGIGLLGLIDLGESEAALETITTLARYEDFTLYAVVAAANWTAGNNIIFQIAQHVHSWGKIHAVERLQPAAEEIREWILRSGCANGVLDAYLGLVCATKGDLISALRQETVDPEMFNSIAIIVDALLDEGPVSGISAYEHAQEALLRYLHHAKQHAQTTADLWRLLNLRDWAEEAPVSYKDVILTRSGEIIHKTDWPKEIITAIEQHDNDFIFFCAANAASRLDIDISAQLFPIIKQEPLKYHIYLPQLMSSPDLATALISCYETVLPLAEMSAGMGDHLFAEELNQEHHCLGFVLSQLANYPLHGALLIKTGLNTRVINCRYAACCALSDWVKALEKPLAVISPDLHREIERICPIEVNEKNKEAMQKLLAGDT